jgi:hypothetical protein
MNSGLTVRDRVLDHLTRIGPGPNAGVQETIGKMNIFNKIMMKSE